VCAAKANIMNDNVSAYMLVHTYAPTL
jgi:hypothetical protein